MLHLDSSVESLLKMEKGDNMGMYGYYFAIDDKLVQQIATGEIALENLKIDD
ncbi:hypothetical protein J14TS5_49260 [Paenibacillus lautus]|nr:hypothetical protein J14TS5_49260 [Paenibacillus lautus]